MTYLAFHLVFLVPPIVLLAAVVARRGLLGGREARALGAVIVIALVYTTPWDNYLVWRGIWAYGPDRVMGTIGYVPVEEYLFFVLQPIMTGLWVLLLLGRGEGRVQAAGAVARWVGAAAYFAAAAVGAVALGRREGTYLGLILVWAAPVLGAQWGYAGAAFWARARVWALGVSVSTLYLAVADTVAIRAGIWRISDAHTLGLSLAGLPLEEAVFFLVTNLLVVQGLLLFLHPPGGAPRPGRAEA